MILEFESETGKHTLVLSKVNSFTLRKSGYKEDESALFEVSVLYNYMAEFYTFSDKNKAETVYNKIKDAFVDINMEKIISHKIEERLSSIK